MHRFSYCALTKILFPKLHKVGNRVFLKLYKVCNVANKSLRPVHTDCGNDNGNGNCLANFILLVIYEKLDDETNEFFLGGGGGAPVRQPHAVFLCLIMKSIFYPYLIFQKEITHDLLQIIEKRSLLLFVKPSKNYFWIVDSKSLRYLTKLSSVNV